MARKIYKKQKCEFIISEDDFSDVIPNALREIEFLFKKSFFARIWRPRADHPGSPVTLKFIYL